MDLSSIIGLVIALGLLMAAAVLEGNGEVAVVIDGLAKPTAAMIVFGGTIGATVVSYPLKTIMTFPKLMALAFKDPKQIEPAEIVEMFVHLSDKARREGLLSLEEEEATVKDPFIRKGIMLIVDGQDPELIRDILEIDIENMKKRHAEGYGVLNAAGGYAPTMGIIGTVMGLIEVLRSLSDPSELGPKVAVAFVATFYGIASANVLWLPLGTKLKSKSDHEVMLREMMLEGVLAVQAGENPRIIRDKLQGYLRPSLRKSDEDAAAAKATPELEEPVAAG